AAPCAALVTIALAPTPSWAQAQSSGVEAASSSIEVIVVTARQREESLQDVPIAVSTVSGEQMLETHITRATEIQNYVPNLTINGAFGVVNPQIFIRGVGNNDFNDNAGATVGVYQDEVYLSAPAGKLVQTYDLESVQVLRGPQGTLFGRNNTAGAITFTSTRPDGEFEGYARATLGNFERLDFEGAMSFPIAEGLSGRVAVQRNTRSGYADSLDASGQVREEIGEIEELAGRVLLRWRSDALDVVLNVNFSDADNDRLPGKSFGVNPDGTDFGGFVNPDPGDIRQNSANYKEIEKVETRGAILNASYELADFTLSSISAYYNAERYVTLDVDKSPNNLLHIIRAPESRQFSQELRITSNGDKTLDWIGGLYYLREDLRVDTLFAFGGPPEPFFPQLYNSDTETYAAYAEVIYSFNDRLSFTGGARYTVDERYFDIIVGGGAAIPFTQFDNEWKEWGWRGILDYKLSDGAMIYASVSRSFQGGGYNGGSFTLAEVGDGFDPEFLLAYEAGAKLSFADGRLSANLAAFYYDYTDPQVFTLDGGQAGGASAGFVSTIVNADSATVKGAEIELVARPTDSLTLNAGIGLLDTAYGELVLPGPNNTIISGEGNELIGAPDVDLSFGFTQLFPVRYGEYSLSADYNYRSRRYFDITQREIMSGDGYGLINARFGFAAPNGWRVGLWGKNLADEEYVTFKADLSTFGGFIENFYDAPRTYGVDFTYRFR
ncbi:MAG TPA: TonB-dependent receptor, partial [Steroidobacteraceae bacterium]|nr:TonB-dependent receptor [Steroidobacteraceae bacterium]